MTKLREWHAFAGSDAFEDPKDALAITPATSWRHAVLEHLDEVDVEHHGFFVAGITHVLLLDEAVQLIDRVVELTEAVTKLAPSDNRLETLYGLRTVRIGLRQRADEQRRVDEPD